MTQTVQPSPATDGKAMHAFLAIFITLAVLGVGIARALGVFRRGSIAGPDRLLIPRAAWDLLLVLCAAFFVANAGALIVLHLVHSANEVSVLSAGIFGIATSLVVLLIAVKRWKTNGIARIGLDANRALVGVVTGVVTIFILFPLIQLVSAGVDFIIQHLHLHQAHTHPLLQTLGATHSRNVEILTVILAVLLAPLQEELLFRGLLQTALCRFFDWIAFESRSTLPIEPPEDGSSSRSRTLSRWSAIAVTSLLFAAVHGEPAFVAPLFLLAVGLGYAYERTGNLWVTITAHGMFNAVQISIFLTMPSPQVG